jgi:hypothetical protein
VSCRVFATSAPLVAAADACKTGQEARLLSVGLVLPRLQAEVLQPGSALLQHRPYLCRHSGISAASDLLSLLAVEVSADVRRRADQRTADKAKLDQACNALRSELTPRLQPLQRQQPLQT